MTVTLTATRTVTNLLATPTGIPPPPGIQRGVTTATGNAGRPDVLIDPGLCWPSVACDGMGDVAGARPADRARGVGERDFSGEAGREHRVDPAWSVQLG